MKTQTTSRIDKEGIQPFELAIVMMCGLQWFPLYPETLAIALYSS